MMRWRAASLAVFAALAIALAQEEEPVPPPRGLYVGNETCKLCHNKTADGKQWSIWHESPHARAFETLKNERSAAIAREQGLTVPAWEAAECLRCHVSTYDFETKTVQPPLQIEHGVQCESCHGPGGAHVLDGRKAFVLGDREVDTAANIVRPNERKCVECHRRQSPTWDPERYTLPNGRKVGFDFPQAFAKMAHPLLSKQDDTKAPAGQPIKPTIPGIRD